MRAIVFILLCCVSFILWQATCGGLLNPLKVLSMYKIGTAFIILSFAGGVRLYKHLKVFCISYAVLMLFPFYPTFMKMPVLWTSEHKYLTTIDIMEYLFFGAWFLYAIGLIIYIYFIHTKNEN